MSAYVKVFSEWRSSLFKMKHNYYVCIQSIRATLKIAGRRVIAYRGAAASGQWDHAPVFVP